MTTKKKAFAGGTGSGSTTAFPALLTTATDPLKGLILHASSGIGATSADVVPGQPAGAVGQVSGADTGVAWQPAGGGLSQPQIVQPGVTTPAVEPIAQPIQGTVQPDVTLPQETIAQGPGQSPFVPTAKELQKERLDQSNNGTGKGARKGISQKQSGAGVGDTANDTVRNASGQLQESGVANPVSVYTPEQAAKQFGTTAQPTTGGILPQQPTALPMPASGRNVHPVADDAQPASTLQVPSKQPASTLQVPSKQPASTLQGRSQVKTKPNQSKACSKEGVVPCSAYQEWIGDKEECTADEYARARGGE